MSSISDPEFAGPKLLDFVTKGFNVRHYSKGDFPHSAIPKLLRHERALVDHCFAHRSTSGNFRSFYVQAVRSAVEDQSWEITRILLEYDVETDERLLESEEDLVYGVIREGCFPAGTVRAWEEPDWMPGIIQLLIDYGAPINHVDAGKKTPLYFVCECGFPKTFQILVDAGADYKTMHNPIPMDYGRDIRTSAQEPQNPDVDLLRCTLNHWMKGNVMFPDGLKDRWGPIILFLLNHGTYPISIQTRCNPLG